MTDFCPGHYKMAWLKYCQPKILLEVLVRKINLSWKNSHQSHISCHLCNGFNGSIFNYTTFLKHFQLYKHLLIIIHCLIHQSWLVLLRSTLMWKQNTVWVLTPSRLHAYYKHSISSWFDIHKYCIYSCQQVTQHDTSIPLLISRNAWRGTSRTTHKKDHVQT